MALTGGRRVTEFLRAPAGTAVGSSPVTVDADGRVDWGAVLVLPTREDHDIDALAAPPATWVTGALTLARGAHCYRIRSPFSVGVRLYNSAAARTADLASGRMPPVLPSSGSGVLAETWLAAANAWDQWQSQVPMLYNGDVPSAATIYWALYSQMTGTTDLTVTITALAIES